MRTVTILGLLASLLAGCVTARVAASPTFMVAGGKTGVDTVATIGVGHRRGDAGALYYVANVGLSILPDSGDAALHDVFGVDYLSLNDELPFRVGGRFGARIDFSDDDKTHGLFGVRVAFFPWSKRGNDDGSYNEKTTLWRSSTIRNVGFELGSEWAFRGARRSDSATGDPGAPGLSTLVVSFGLVVEWNVLSR